MKNTPEAAGRPSPQQTGLRPATPQQIYLRRAAHSAAMYFGYQCRVAQAPDAATAPLPDGDLPPELAQAPYLRTVFTQPAGITLQAPDLHPSVTIEWHGPTPTCAEGANSSLATYVQGLAREILARMGQGPKAKGGQS